MPLVFGDYTLDIDRRELSRGGERVALAPQVFDLLVYIVRNRDHVVSKDDLIEAVWDGRIVSESAVTTRLNALRNAIGDSGAEQRLIRTVSRRGVRFVGEVREENGLPIAAALTSEPPRARTSTRRLAAILAADVAGYSRLIGVDKEGTLSRLKGLRAEVVDPKISEHHGRIVKTTGDGLLVEFASVVDALRCATEIQAAMAESNAPLPADKRIDLRIGINMGEIVVEDGEIFGDGVNVAARLEGLAEPGGICVSARVQEDAEGRVDLAFEDMGEQVLRNIARPVRAYRVRTTLTRPDANAMGSPLSCNAREDAERQGREAGKGGSPELPLPDKPSM